MLASNAQSQAFTDQVILSASHGCWWLGNGSPPKQSSLLFSSLLCNKAESLQVDRIRRPGAWADHILVVKGSDRSTLDQAPAPETPCKVPSQRSRAPQIRPSRDVIPAYFRALGVAVTAWRCPPKGTLSLLRCVTGQFSRCVPIPSRVGAHAHRGSSQSE